MLFVIGWRFAKFQISFRIDSTFLFTDVKGMVFWFDRPVAGQCLFFSLCRVRPSPFLFPLHWPVCLFVYLPFLPYCQSFTPFPSLFYKPFLREFAIVLALTVPFSVWLFKGQTFLRLKIRFRLSHLCICIFSFFKMNSPYATILDNRDFNPVVWAEKIDKLLRDGKKEDVAHMLASISNKQRQMVSTSFWTLIRNIFFLKSNAM